MRRFHRFLAVFAVFIGLYVSVTGIVLQAIDLKVLLTQAPASDPDLRAIREGRNGPPNFVVAKDSDVSAAPLPADFNFGQALARTTGAARAQLYGAPLSLVEFRMVGQRPVGQVASRGAMLRVDLASGTVEPLPKLGPPPPGLPSLRNTVKNIHRMLAYGDVGVAIFFVLALAMCAMLVTGLTLYVRLLRARLKLGRPSPFWSAGSAWRSLHRAVAVASALFLIVVVGSGTLLAFGDVGVSAYRLAHHGTRPGTTVDVSAPLSDAQLAAMLRVTLASWRADHPAEAIRVLRLRSFAGMPQGVVVTGGDDARQVAYDATTGAVASLSGAHYPATGQPFGWAEDQFVKGIHRGDAFGMVGRWISLFTGLSLLFLSMSGGVTYWELWNRRRIAGRRGLFWP
ncbi:PepSY-associated TM helix domain-containing protein [Novosphingobium terrae]|uniref:PepSY-associated TM helix domain-containing protein n=1 Tax=Novosphingobium terrae TaxID=2726189 RepID=UPI001980F952|nr:PepSY-associated TM helix domain-containing protein [Novosphingobium terrae]